VALLVLGDLRVSRHDHRIFGAVGRFERFEGGGGLTEAAFGHVGAGGSIGPGDVQWMTAGRGIVHEEYHGSDYARRGGPFEMLQLWVNLPAKDKRVAPGYQGITSAQIPRVELPEAAGTVRVIAGELQGVEGPARSYSPMNLWDLRLVAGKPVRLTVPAGHTTALFVLKGALRVDGSDAVVGEAELAVLEREGDTLQIEAVEDTTLLLLGGEPLKEPVVGQGPFVMNTQAEIRQAFLDYQSGQLDRP
jgi:redox-sensitive bicupin YhaK (pirin superfamily)